MDPEKLPLKDIHLPEAIGWWPPAPGWWLLVILVPAMVALLLRMYKRMTRKTALKEATKLLEAIKKDSGKDERQKLQELSELFRRTAISHYPRTEAASLTGDAWLVFLQQPMQDTRFTEGVGRLLVDAPYRKLDAGEIPIDQLTDLCADWLRALARNKT